MASSNSNTPLLYSPPSTTNQHWLNNSTQIFLNHLDNNTNLPICIFQLPETLTSQNSNSYIPHHIGLGPIHHFHNDLYTRQAQLKLITTKNFLKPYKIITPQLLKTVHEKVTHVIPQVRCCYELYFDINDECLAWVFVIDAFFLLNVLSRIATPDGDPLEFLEDVIKIENQISLVILVQLLTALHDQYSTDDLDDFFLSHMLVKFCESQSPLKFAKQETELDPDLCNTFHLLDCLYLFIVTHNLPPKNPSLRVNFLVDVGLEDVENAVQMAGGLFPGVNVFLQPALMVLKLPWDKIGTLIKKVAGGNENLKTLEINIPSVSKLVKVGKVNFLATQGGIHDIKFDEENRLITLPVLDMKQGSEVVLRNLVAYEGLMFKKNNIRSLDLTEYVDFMCGIIDGVKDVKILRENNIIEGNMDDEKIAKLFNGIMKSSLKTDGKKSELQKTIDRVNTYFGNIPRVKVFNFAKRLFLASWKIFAIVFSVLSLALMIVMGVCQVYDCKDRFTLGHVRSVLDYATWNNKVVDF